MISWRLLDVGVDPEGMKRASARCPEPCKNEVQHMVRFEGCSAGTITLVLLLVCGITATAAFAYFFLRVTGLGSGKGVVWAKGASNTASTAGPFGESISIPLTPFLAWQRRVGRWRECWYIWTGVSFPCMSFLQKYKPPFLLFTSIVQQRAENRN
jgi:hypothetical protein